MEAQNKWGGSFLAVVFAVAVIGAASFYYFQNQSEKGANLPDGITLEDWKSVSSTPSLSASGNISEALSSDLYMSYLNLTEDGEFTAAERDAMLAALAKKHAAAPQIVPIITLADLNIQENASIDTYTKLFAVIISQASLVKKYEVTLFTEAVVNNDTDGIPALQGTADLYKKIAASLLVMEVPPKIAPEHLEAVKSVGALAKAVENMAKWNGDPIEALADVDTFNKAQNYVTDSMDTLLVTITALQKKT